MSLINKMLQDLDARGGSGVRSTDGIVRPVAAEASPRKAIAIGAAAGALIVAVGGGAWYWMHRAPAPVAPAPVVRAPAPAPAPALAPPVAAAPAALPAPVVAVETPAPEPVGEPPVRAPRKPVREHKAKESHAAAAMRDQAERASPAPAAGGITVTPQQQGENAYRRALAALQDGRVQDAVGALESAVAAAPRHVAARQTLVGLLVENGRADDAIRQAQQGLALDANQPQLAMLLARLELERGGPAIDTLQRTLPHATDHPDYLAFFAGVLQKANRHREAAAQYEAALKLRPQNGVWWMGLGMALQADQQRGPAREAYQKAKAAGLTTELQAFVDRRLAQLN